MVSREEFINYVKKTIKQEDHNELNKNKTRYNGIRYTALVVGLVLLVWFIIDITKGGLFALYDKFAITKGFFAAFALVIFAIITFYRSAVIKSFGSEYKKQFVDYLLQDTTHTYEENGIVNEEMFRKTGLGMDYKIYTGEDKLTLNIPNDDGTDSEVYLEIGDVCASVIVEDDDGSTRKVPRFNGCFGFVKFPQNFNCHLTLNRGTWMNRKKMEKVDLEDIKFSQEFGVKASDQIEARYILTPDLMQKLCELKSRVKSLEIIFADNMMYIGMSRRQLFNLGLQKKDQGAESMFLRYYDDIEILLSIVKEIQTNNKVFKM